VTFLERPRPLGCFAPLAMTTKTRKSVRPAGQNLL
jgi:hypothetical protein